jgi:nucleoside-diphosphate-sugar epimerase
MKSVLITGSSGFIGKHLIKALEEQGIEVVTFDREDGLDITNSKDFLNLPKTDVVFHLGAVSGYKDSNADTSLAYEVNVGGTINVLEYCRKIGAKMMFPSTYVYTKPHNEYKKEADLTKTSTHYAQTKLLGERTCQFYSRVFKVDTLIMRTSNVYGLGQNSKYIVPIIADHILKMKPLTLTKPEIERTYIYITDLVRAYVELATAKTKPGDVYNVAGAKPTSLAELIKLIEAVTVKKAQVEYSGKSRLLDVDVNRFDITKIKEKINWKPEVDLEEGLKKYFNFLK